MANNKLTNEEAYIRITDRGFKLLSNYTYASDKHLFMCERGHTWEARFFSVDKQKSGCPICKRLSKEQALKRVQDLGFILLDNYKGTTFRYNFKCSKGHIWETNFSTLNDKYRCPECRKLQKEDIDNMLLKRNIVLLDDFNGTNNKYNFKCSKGHTWKAAFISVYYQGNGCAECSKTKKLTQEEAVNNSKESGFELLSKFSNTSSHYNFKCSKGHIFKSSYTNVVHGGWGCNVCKESKGERKIRLTLDKYDISYKKEYTIGKYRYDFYLTEYNTFIEYDGIQHYEPVDFFGGLDEFNKCKERDSIKDQIADKGNIKMIRIPYYEYINIDNIIKTKIIIT